MKLSPISLPAKYQDLVSALDTIRRGIIAWITIPNIITVAEPLEFGDIIYYDSVNEIWTTASASLLRNVVVITQQDDMPEAAEFGKIYQFTNSSVLDGALNPIVQGLYFIRENQASPGDIEWRLLTDSAPGVDPDPEWTTKTITGDYAIPGGGGEDKTLYIYIGNANNKTITAPVGVETEGYAFGAEATSKAINVSGTGLAYVVAVGETVKFTYTSGEWVVEVQAAI